MQSFALFKFNQLGNRAIVPFGELCRYQTASLRENWKFAAFEF